MERRICKSYRCHVCIRNRRSSVSMIIRASLILNLPVKIRVCFSAPTIGETLPVSNGISVIYLVADGPFFRLGLIRVAVGGRALIGVLEKGASIGFAIVGS